MDIDDIRRANIRHLEHEAGSPAAAADHVWRVREPDRIYR